MDASKVKYEVDHHNREVRAKGPRGNEIGYLSLEKYGEPAKNNEAFNMAVKPAWQRKGIMRNLHDIAEQHFGQINPSRTLSNEGFSFWKTYRPEAVKDRYRFHADKFIGQEAPTPYGNGIISSVGDRAMIATLPKGNTALVNRDHAQFLFDQAQSSDDITKGDGGEVDGGITAYHGSPHEFEQFDTSMIGSGEGNQAYGHGLYFAEHENVAKGYRNALSSGTGGEGHMYEVHIDAHPDHFIDYNKTLNNQHPFVKERMRNALAKKYNSKEIANETINSDADFKDIIDNFDDMQPHEISKMFHDEGIQGIKYLDQRSRNLNPKDPTRNYVVFDHDRVKVKRRYEQGGEVEAPQEEPDRRIAKKPAPIHNPAIIEHALGKVAAPPPALNHPLKVAKWGRPL